MSLLHKAAMGTVGTIIISYLIAVVWLSIQVAGWAGTLASGVVGWVLAVVGFVVGVKVALLVTYIVVPVAMAVIAAIISLVTQ